MRKFHMFSKQLRSKFPAIDNIPYYSTNIEAGVVLLKEDPERLLKEPKMCDPKKL